MRNTVWIMILLLIFALGGGFLALGAFAPEPRPQPIVKILPNDRFPAKP